MERFNINLPKHLLRGERRAFTRNGVGTFKTILTRKLVYPTAILFFVALLAFGFHQSQ